MHDAAVTGVVIGLMGLGGFAGLVAGRYIWPSLRGIHTTIRELKAEAALEADEAYVEGWDDALADRLRGDADTTILRLGPPSDLPDPATDVPLAGTRPAMPTPRAGEPHDFLHPDWEQLAPGNIDLPSPMWADGGPVTDDDWRQMNQMVPLPPRRHDFLHPDWEQLAPGNIDLPSPASDMQTSVRAGQLHQDQDKYRDPLPAFLHLGAEYTGDDKWRARMTWRGWDQVARHEAARARLALECGIRFVPMDELEAAA